MSWEWLVMKLKDFRETKDGFIAKKWDSHLWPHAVEWFFKKTGSQKRD